MPTITDNLRRIERGISEACQGAGRLRDSVQLVAVSKTKSPQQVAEAIEAGQVEFGENHVQELIVKQPRFPKAHWHFIGHLQKNKIRKALPCCDLLHTLDSIALIDRVDRISGELGLRTRALLQVNISGDSAKFGFAPVETEEALDTALEKENLVVQGLMTIPAFDPDPEKTRPRFAALRELRGRLAESRDQALPDLSMGMSHDYHVAIEEGATLVRIGSSIFGGRTPH